MKAWPFGALRPLRYRLILADCPWLFENYSEKGEHKSPSGQYSCMTLDDLKALPVSHLAAPDCLLVAWGTAPMLPQLLETVDAWGFRYITMGAWAKRARGGEKWSFGTGYWLRSALEPFILAAVGSPRIKARNVRNLIDAPVREHSRKPDEMHANLERLTDGPRCELFGREEREGWEVWGNEKNKFNAP